MTYWGGKKKKSQTQNLRVVAGRGYENKVQGVARQPQCEALSHLGQLSAVHVMAGQFYWNITSSSKTSVSLPK